MATIRLDASTEALLRIQVNELVFVVEEAPETGYTAAALGQAIFVEADDLDDLRWQVRDAVRCHFDDGRGPRLIRLRFVHEEVIAP